MEPLRDSFVLDHIDLSLVRLHESPDMKCKPLLSEACVLPILDGIVPWTRIKFGFNKELSPDAWYT